MILKTSQINAMNRKIRADQCLYCNSRKCYKRIFAPGKYDEIACPEHVKNLDRDVLMFVTNNVVVTVENGTTQKKRQIIYAR